MKLKFTFLCLLLLMISQSTIAQTDSWKKKYDKKGLIIYTRGKHTSEYKAVMNVNADVKSCVALLQDVNEHPKFMGSVKSSKVVKDYSDKDHLVYMIIDMPFLMADRDIVSRADFTYVKKDKKVLVNITSLPDAYPDKDLERMNVADGYWLFEPLGPLLTRVTYQLKFEPAKAPNWLIEYFVLENPKNVMLGFSEMVQNKKYSETTIAWMQ